MNGAAPKGRRLWQVVGVAGELLITAGVVLLLMVVYELWWTNVEAEAQIQIEREELRESWAAAPVPTDVALAPIPAEAFGLMYIPRLRDDVWATPLIEGVTSTDLAKGMGHFTETVLPGEIGNTAYAGHRATHGEPLAHVDQLVAGDLVYIETGSQWFGYQLTEDQLVQPDDVWVLDPVPGEPPGTEPTKAIVTLVTCHPRWGSTQRWIWWGELVETRGKDDPPPAVLEMSAGG